jgi:hypothetical protein
MRLVTIIDDSSNSDHPSPRLVGWLRQENRRDPRRRRAFAALLPPSLGILVGVVALAGWATFAAILAGILGTLAAQFLEAFADHFEIVGSTRSVHRSSLGIAQLEAIFAIMWA